MKYFFWEEVDVDKEGSDEDEVHDEGSEEGGEADHHQLLGVLRAPDGGWGEEADVGLSSVVTNSKIRKNRNTYIQLYMSISEYIQTEYEYWIVLFKP